MTRKTSIEGIAFGKTGECAASRQPSISGTLVVDRAHPPAFYKEEDREVLIQSSDSRWEKISVLCASVQYLGILGIEKDAHTTPTAVIVSFILSHVTILSLLSWCRSVRIPRLAVPWWFTMSFHVARNQGNAFTPFVCSKMVRRRPLHWRPAVIAENVHQDRSRVCEIQANAFPYHCHECAQCKPRFDCVIYYPEVTTPCLRDRLC